MRTSAILMMRSTFKQADRGLYAGCHITFGDRMSDFGNRSRRTWRPNAQRVYLYSETLKERLLIRVTTDALLLIDKAGGLDNYLLEQRHPESDCADKLRRRILQRRLEVENLMNSEIKPHRAA